MSKEGFLIDSESDFHPSQGRVPTCVPEQFFTFPNITPGKRIVLHVKRQRSEASKIFLWYKGVRGVWEYITEFGTSEQAMIIESEYFKPGREIKLHAHMIIGENPPECFERIERRLDREISYWYWDNANDDTFNTELIFRVA